MAHVTQIASLVNVMHRLGINRQRAFDFSALLSGQVGRLMCSMVYFVVLASALSLEQFGVFATCSAIGIVLSRMTGLGFISPLFRVATTKPRLIGDYTGGFLIATLVSTPLLTAVAFGIYALLYADLIPLTAFLLIIMAEVLMWRGLEAVIIVNNGLNRYALASAIGIGGVAAKAVAATYFLLSDVRSLEIWAQLYFGILAASCLIAVVLFYPRQRLRWRPKAWLGRAKDAIGVSWAEALFYVQAEMDKVLVLALGGEMLAGLYAICMRLIDLTAMPVRAFNTMLTQWIMRQRKSGGEPLTGLRLDLLIAFVSIAAMAAMAIILSLAPGILGQNIALATSYLWLLLLVPAFRNAIELHTELLYGHERMKQRVLLLAYLTVMKGLLLAVLLGQVEDFHTIALWLNGMFAVLYLVSAIVTYGQVLQRSNKNERRD
ncbi:MAG: lipopolysaccharide biosynthesis protein [Pseudomonadota bacterium]